MSDPTATGEPTASTRDVVSITDAAKRLRVSVRTVQRRLDAGTLAAVETEGGRRVHLLRDNATPNATGDTTTRQDDAPTAQSVARHDATTNATNATFELKTNATEGDTQRDSMGEVSRDNATTNSTAMQVLAEEKAAGAARLVEVLERENAFLRLQVEAANRATAEAHAALREALKMSNRALTEGRETDVSPDNGHDFEQLRTGGESVGQVLADGVSSPTNAPQSPQSVGAGKVLDGRANGLQMARRRTFRAVLLRWLRG